MPPLYSPPLDVIQPHNPMEHAQSQGPNKLLLPIVAARSKYYSYSD